MFLTFIKVYIYIAIVIILFRENNTYFAINSQIQQKVSAPWFHWQSERNKTNCQIKQTLKKNILCLSNINTDNLIITNKNKKLHYFEFTFKIRLQKHEEQRTFVLFILKSTYFVQHEVKSFFCFPFMASY